MISGCVECAPLKANCVFIPGREEGRAGQGGGVLGGRGLVYNEAHDSRHV